MGDGRLTVARSAGLHPHREAALSPTFAPLRHPRFRSLWLAGLVSFLGTWTHNVAARWAAATLSAAPLAVSAIDTAQLAPMVLLTVAAGRLADRVDRRRLLVQTNLGLAACAGLMGAAAAADLLSLGVLYGVSIAMGVLSALNGPAWQATVPRQVPDHEVPAAVNLMSTGFNLARSVGPALGAWMLVEAGPAWAFWANAATYSLIAFLMARLPPQEISPAPEARARPWRVPALRRLYAAVFAFGLLAMPSLSLLAVVARDRVGGDASAYGTLLGAFGAGAVATGLLVASATARFGRRFFVAASIGLSALGLAVLSGADGLGPAIAGALVCGAGWIGTLSTINAAVQLQAPPGGRGEILGAYLAAAVAGQATGSFVWGWAASPLGLEGALRACSLGLAVLSVLVWRARPGPAASRPASS